MALLVLLAIYTSMGRMLAANLPAYRTGILKAMNEHLPFTVDAAQVRGEWRGFTPVLILTQLRLGLPGGASAPLALTEGRVSVDVLDSLRTRSLQMSRLELDGLSLRGELSERGELRFRGFGDSGSEPTVALREFLLNVESVILRRNSLLLTLPDGGERELELDLTLVREGSERRVQAALTSTAGTRISVMAQGLGDPFRPGQFSGQAYLDLQSTNLGALRDMLPTALPPAWAEGEARLELWLHWERGSPTLQARLEARDLQLAAPDDAWQVSLQRVALQAQLESRADDWTLFVSDVDVESGGAALSLPRLQLERQGSKLRLRAADVPLEPIGALLAQQERLPESLRKACAALRPRGELPLLQVLIDDTARAAEAWSARATFSGLAVDAWHGAPGVTGANGYAQLAPGSASVVLDSQAFSLDFPDVYRAPLRFEELYGNLRVAWDAGAVRLDSGLLTARGEEGTNRVLFGLDIPLRSSETGIEMDLLVGLQDSHARHRAKYIPYVLDPALLSWLADSIGDGSVEQGAFLWRGSLRPGASPLRSVQLAFNVADTWMTYHPRWPPVLVREGTVLIDDSAVSVWATRADLLDSAVAPLSVETRLNEGNELTLDIRGSVHGPAVDGLRVLNESALAGIVGEAFSGWSATGCLQTDLAIHMNLGNPVVAPRVNVATRWQDVDLLIAPGNLPVQAVSGEFTYSTTTGFHARSLTGRLWGEPLTIDVRQRHNAPGGEYAPAATVVEVAMAADVEMAALRDWLQLEFLGFANGRAAARATLRLSPGEPPLLTVDSDLVGVSLDLPQPWNKTASELRPLHVEAPLSRAGIPLSLALAPGFSLRLDMAGGKVQSAAAGFGIPPAAAAEGELRLAGQVPLVRVSEWLDFGEHYAGAMLTGMALNSAATPAVVPGPAGHDASTRAAVSKRAGASLMPIVDALRIDSLVVLEQEIQDVVVDLAHDAGHWKASLHTDWLRAALLPQRDTGAPRLLLEHLDLDHLPDFGASGVSGESTWEIPVIEVDINNLVQSGKHLGHLELELAAQGMDVSVRNMTGELASLQLPAENPLQLTWHRGPAASTELAGSLQFADLGQTLEFFDYQRIVQTEQGSVEFGLRWPGAPQDFALSAAEGTMQIRIGHGSFLEATAGATGALRVVSILNLADIVRRLSVANMFESGIPFDSVDGELEVGDGQLQVVRMEVKGGSSFRFTGGSDLKAQTIAAEMVATLPVASNLPWIAALAASLPVAAGVYVVSQVFDRQMSRLSSAVYTITGTWQDPDVNFDRIFDNTAHAAPQSAPDAQSPP